MQTWVEEQGQRGAEGRNREEEKGGREKRTEIYLRMDKDLENGRRRVEKRHRQARQSSDCKEGTEILRVGTAQSECRTPPHAPSSRDLLHPYTPQA